MLGYGTSKLSQRPQPSGVAIVGTPVATAQAGRAAAQVFPLGDRQRHPLRTAHRVFLADAAPRPAALAHRLPLLPHLAPGRNLAAGARRPARHAATGSKLELSHLDSVSIIHGENVEVPATIAERWRLERDIRDERARLLRPGHCLGVGAGPQHGAEVPELAAGDTAQPEQQPRRSSSRPVEPDGKADRS